MSLFGGITNVINPVNVTLIAGGPAGWTALAARSLLSAVGNQLIQQLGQQLGLPQSTIDAAQGAFSAATGDYQGAAQSVQDVVGDIAQQTGASPFEAGQAQGQIEDAISQAASFLAQSEEGKSARFGGGKSWLMAIAEALGRTSDKLANEMNRMSQTLGGGNNQSSQNLQFAAKSQEFAQFFSSANNVIKTLGEALTQGARKS